MSNYTSNLCNPLPNQTTDCFPSQPDSSYSLSSGSPVQPDYFIDSPALLLKNQRNSNILKNLTKKVKNPANCKPGNKTAKKQKLLIKKTIKKPPKMPAKNEKNDILEVSGSTFASNTTPKICQQACEDYMQESEEVLRPESLLQSSQGIINSSFMDGTLGKFKLDEVL